MALNNVFRFNVKSVSKGSKSKSCVDKFSYNSRILKYENLSDVVLSKTFNLPNQFRNEIDFWGCVDKFEKQKNILYLDIEANLPNNLNMKSYEKIVDNFVLNTFSKNTPVSYAIHIKTQIDNTLHPHVHIMVNTRIFDNELCLKKDLFKNGNTYKCKDYTRYKFCEYMRSNFEMSCNTVLKELNIKDSVSKDSYLKQRDFAIQNNELVLARALYKAHSLKRENNTDTYRKYEKAIREYKKEHNLGDTAMSDIDRQRIKNIVDKNDTEYEKIQRSKRIANLEAIRELKHEKQVYNKDKIYTKEDLSKYMKTSNNLYDKFNKDVNLLNKKDYSTSIKRQLFNLIKSDLSKDKAEYSYDIRVTKNNDKIELMNLKNIFNDVNSNINAIRELVLDNNILQTKTTNLTDVKMKNMLTNQSVITTLKNKIECSKIANLLNREIIDVIHKLDDDKKLEFDLFLNENSATKNGLVDKLTEKLQNMENRKEILDVNNTVSDITKILHSDKTEKLDVVRVLSNYDNIIENVKTELIDDIEFSSVKSLIKSINTNDFNKEYKEIKSNVDYVKSIRNFDIDNELNERMKKVQFKGKFDATKPNLQVHSTTEDILKLYDSLEEKIRVTMQIKEKEKAQKDSVKTSETVSPSSEKIGGIKGLFSRMFKKEVSKPKEQSKPKKDTKPKVQPIPDSVLQATRVQFNDLRLFLESEESLYNKERERIRKEIEAEYQKNIDYLDKMQNYETIINNTYVYHNNFIDRQIENSSFKSYLADSEIYLTR